MNTGSSGRGKQGRRPHAAAAFTLIELIVVIAIIAVLVAIIFPAIANARQAAYRTTALSQLQQLGQATLLYSNTYDGFLPASTNYGLSTEDENRIWPNLIFTDVGSSKGPFIAKGSNGMFPANWKLRGWGSFGMNSATAVDPEGCDENQADKTNCSAFQSAANIDQKTDNPSMIPLFSTTPAGDTAKSYRGYEFNPYNGLERTSDVRQSPPLVSDRDLVLELPVLPGDLKKPIYARYNATGNDEGFAPVLFADYHAKAYQAKSIKFGKTGILWRFR